MFPIRKCPIPPDTLLDKYSTEGTYVDCYSIEIHRKTGLPEFIFAFYTTPLFKLERRILAWAVSKPSTDHQAQQLADCETEAFAAWIAESRREHELLMCDSQGRTRSWLMALPADGMDGARTRLYFGSAVVPVQNPKTGQLSLGLAYRALLGFHKIYSVLLLYFAAFSLKRQRFRIPS